MLAPDIRAAFWMDGLICSMNGVIVMITKGIEGHRNGGREVCGPSRHHRVILPVLEPKRRCLEVFGRAGRAGRLTRNGRCGSMVDQPCRRPDGELK